MDPHPVPALRPQGLNGYEGVSFERTHDGQVGVITWKSKKMNPLSVELSNELVAAVEEAYADEELKVVVLRGLGGYFSVGDDLVEMHEGAWGDPNQVMRRIRFYQRFANTIEELDKVTIAVAEGFVLGGGLEITMACDFVLAPESCKWGMPEVDSGMTPGWGGTTRMIRLIGRRRAKEVNMIGAIHSAARAVDWGLFNRAVPDADLEDELSAFVELMLTKNQQTMRQLKFVLNKNADADVQTALAFEAMNEVITSAVNWRGDTPPVPDAEPGAGLEAFTEKNELWERRREAAIDFWSG
ncbi:MAG TPA: enoyl-CoA hydratase/isomerase family protein [Thermoleophilaceae bacterium]